MIFPAPLRKGDSLQVVAPSGPFDLEMLDQGLARLHRYRALLPSGMKRRRSGFFAGSDEERLDELQRALDCPDSRAILVARGGYGVSRLLPLLDFSGFAKNPKWLIGFSDTTALHLRFLQEGYASLHASNGTTLANLTLDDEEALYRALEESGSSSFPGLSCIQRGKATGTLVGGNLTVLHSEAVAGRLGWPAGAILFLEDVDETSYRIDRMLTSLIAGGYFENLGGIVLGEFKNCSAGRFNVSTSTVLSKILSQLGLPIASGLTSGHGDENAPLILGSRASLDADLGNLGLEAN